MERSWALAWILLLAGCDCGGGSESEPASLRIDAVDPPVGPVAGGTQVEIRGQGFSAETAVLFGGLPATDIQFLNVGLLRAKSPAADAVGAVDVTVEVGHATDSLSDGFLYIAGPRVDAVEPAQGSVGGATAVVVTGAGFQEGAAVWFGNALATEVRRVSDGVISAVTPPGAPGLVDVTVENPDAQSGVLPNGFEYLFFPQCRVQATTPSPGEVDVPVVSTLRVEWSTPVDLAGVEVALQEVGGELADVDVEPDGDAAVVLRPLRSLHFWSAYVLSIGPGTAAADGAACEAAAAAFATVVPMAGPRELRPSSISGLAVVGDYALAAAPGYRGLQVYDVSDPGAVALLGDVPTAEEPISIVVSGDRAYVPAGYEGTLIFDVSEPSLPVQVGRAGSPGWAGDAAPFERNGQLYLAVADRIEGVRLLDVTDPEGVRDLGRVDPSGARSADVRGVDVQDDLLAIANGELGLALANLTDPEAPEIVVSVPTGRAVLDVLLDGNVLYALNGYLGVQSWDISDPETPQVIDGVADQCQYDCVDYVSSMVWSGDELIVAAGRSGVFRVSRDADAHLDLVATLGTPGFAGAIAAGSSSIIAGAEGGLVSFASDAATGDPPLWASDSGHGLARAVMVSGSNAYVAASSRGLQTFDVSVPAAPRYLGRDDSPGSSWADIAAFSLEPVLGGVVLGDGRAGIALYDTEDDRADPVLAGSLAGRDRISGMAVAGTTLFACDDNYGVLVADVSDLHAPVELAYVAYRDISPADQCYDLLHDDDVLYMASRQYLSALDISEVSSPSLIGQFSLRANDAVTALALRGNYLYAATVIADYEAEFGRLYRVQVFDVADPSSPQRVFVSEDLGAASDVVVAGDILFVAGQASGIYVFDAADPADLILEGVVDMPGDPVGLYATDEGLYAAQREGGLQGVRTGPLPFE